MSSLPQNSLDVYAMSKPEWLKEAMPIEEVSIDAGFHISKSFYYGPVDEYLIVPEHEMREPLYQPELKHRGTIIMSSEAVASPKELQRYYHDVMRTAERWGKELGSRSPYFGCASGSSLKKRT